VKSGNRSSPIGASLHRLDASYTAIFVPAMMSLVGKVPDAITVLYHSFVERYPNIAPNAFKALNANVLSEVGIGVVLLGGRLDIAIRVDQMIGQAINLQNHDEVQFTLDCTLLAHSVVRKLSTETTLGQTTLTISTWLKIDGGQSVVDTLLGKVSHRSSALFDKKRIGAQTLRYLPRIDFSNATEGWRAVAAAEPSVISEADLFVRREYAFSAHMKYSTFEQQLGFVDSSTSAIFEWLGVKTSEDNTSWSNNLA
jgi:hypothetical protein